MASIYRLTILQLLPLTLCTPHQAARQEGFQRVQAAMSGNTVPATLEANHPVSSFQAAVGGGETFGGFGDAGEMGFDAPFQRGGSMNQPRRTPSFTPGAGGQRRGSFAGTLCACSIVKSPFA
jgi:hypothetical protein